MKSEEDLIDLTELYSAGTVDQMQFIEALTQWSLRTSNPIWMRGA